MRSRSSFHPQAKRELREAVLYYRAIDPVLAHALVSEAQALVAEIVEHPLLGVEIASDVRVRHLRRFPYAVFYVPTAHAIRVVAVAHQHRRPLYWLERVQSPS